MADSFAMEPQQRSMGDIIVSVFKNTMATGRPDSPAESRRGDYSASYIEVEEMTLREFLDYGTRYLDTIQRLRTLADKKARDAVKRRELPCATISARLKNRLRGIPMEEKLIAYNSLIVLDFDGLEDPESAKNDLAQLPFFWYIGLSVSGRGLFGIVPVDTEDWHEHKTYFAALKKDLSALGYQVDDQCKDVGRLRVVSYDEHPYYNPDCEIYTLPGNDMDDDPFPEPLSRPEDISDNERLALYVQEWERKRIPLDDYGDWLTIGMALAGQGEAGKAAFRAVSRFSSKYDEAANDRKFDELARSTHSIGLGSFYYKCHAYGVIPDSIPHYACIPFPVEVFPRKVQDIITKTHIHQNFPIDYIAPSLLFVACMACGNSCVVELLAGWQEKPLLYLAIVGGRGTNKTSCFEFALAPIRAKDDEEYDNYLAAKARYDVQQAKPLKDRKPNLEPPLYRQYILSDFTPEVLVRQHKANPRGLIVFFDELIGFIYSFNKYRSGSDEQMWTQLFAGGGVTVNRVSSETVKINDTCIGIFGGIQPEILRSFARGKIQNGFIDRWIFAYPDKVRYPKFNDVDIDASVRKNWNKIISRILKLPYDGTPRVIRFSKEAKQAYKEWFDRLSDQKNNGGEAFAGLATKMDRYCARFALGLEVLKYACGESRLEDISLDSIRGAISLSYYFTACGLKAQKQFISSPVAELPALQKLIYEELPPSFETGQGVAIADSYGMPERTFKRWLSTSYFKKLNYGYYEKKYR